MSIVHGIRNYVPQNIVSGVIGSSDYQIDSLVPHKFAVRVQIDREQAEYLVRLSLRDHPSALQRVLADDDALCDALVEVVRSWVATFPLVPE